MAVLVMATNAGMTTEEFQRIVTVRGDNQDERAASIRMRMRRGRADGKRA